MSKKLILILLGVAAVIIIGITFFTSDVKEEIVIETEVKKGKFDISTTTTGELQAKNSQKITGPSGLRQIQVYNVKISDLIPDGSFVKKGDYVGTLDRTEAEGKLKDTDSEFLKMESQYTKTKLDTTIELRTLRDNLINLKYNMEEAEINFAQSKFEPPAKIRQLKIALEKSERTFEQTEKNYKLKKEQAEAKMVEVSSNLNKQIRKKELIEKVLGEFTITAPSDGMLTYAKEWNGSKKKVGSTISAWNPTVATLPDLKSMISKTYINEIDISKIKVGQKVDISVDAFPDMRYTGEITEVANIGEQLPNSDAKVFEVIIKVNQVDSILKPSMTTGNKILINNYEDVIYIALDAIQNNDSVSYVFVKSGLGLRKQIIETGEANDNEIIIKQGLKKGDIVLLNTPDNENNIKFSGIEIYEVLKAKKKKELEEQKILQAERDKKDAIQDSLGGNKRDSGSGGFGFVIIE